MSKVTLKVVDVKVVMELSVEEAWALHAELGAQPGGGLTYHIFDKLDDALKLDLPKITEVVK